MGWVNVVLRAVIAIALLGSVVVQVAIVAALWLDTAPDPAWFEITFVVLGVLGVATCQVVGVCVWRLLTMVRRGTVFSSAAFRFVDVMIGAIAAAAVVLFAIAVVARFANHDVPEDEVAPGLVALVCGLALVTAGVALLVYVMRTLLAQAVALDADAKHLRAELDEVI
ncbi:DUF2975 domain-containing protein [Nocardioides sp. BGMRC 2183]|nr:DUF2975 domain-containing protein [Nocardioides sp. BGMRC 2183]